ncbi:cytochrome c family protein [Magnetospirillum sp. UT-4]|uniref:cytochrome c family protein n=1 Tax=Magnetospirillum sp. UT-4 TaxID=2681467 RepID=UPI0013844512|nr:cytochrome c family protein [Magnetospirillum sp. UT-4]CAA7620505.1 Perchlorate reductase subunit gamma [Magnetospirillum sp. UT-4]
MNIFLPFLSVLSVLWALSAAQAADKATYEGFKVCAKCHDLQAEAWQATSHAKAFDILKPGQRAEAKVKAKVDPNKDYTADPGCLGCHTTGYGEPGGYDPAMPPAQAKALAGVGCESCHGPGSQFKKEHGDAEGRFKKGGATTDRKVLVEAGQTFDYEKACVKCHGVGTNKPGSPFNALVDPKYAFEFDKAVRTTGKGKGVHDHFKLIGVFSGQPVHRLRAEFQSTAKEGAE